MRRTQTSFVRASYEQLRFASKWHGLTPGVSLPFSRALRRVSAIIAIIVTVSIVRVGAEQSTSRSDRRPSSLHIEQVVAWFSADCSILRAAPSTTSRLHRHVSSAPQKHTRTPGSCASRRPPTTPTKPPLKQLVSHESWHIYPSICLSIRPSVRLSVRLFIHPSIHLFIHLLVRPPAPSYVYEQNTKATARDKRQRQERHWCLCARLGVSSSLGLDSLPSLHTLKMKQSLIPLYVITRIVPSHRQTTDQEFTTLSITTLYVLRFISCVTTVAVN